MITKPRYDYAYHHRARSSVRYWRKYLKQGAIALITFLLTASLLNQIIPSPAIPPNIVFVSPKYEHYLAHKDDYNALFFGSSRVYNHIIPQVFDEAAAAAGTEARSFNFGIPAQRSLAGYVLLKEVLRTPPKHLKWVFIETPLDPGYEPIQNARTSRTIYWHTAENTRMALRYILTSDESALRKAVLSFSHLLPFAYNELNIGRLFYQWIPVQNFTDEEEAISQQVLARQGYYPLGEDSDPKRQAFLSHLVGYRQSVATLTEQKARMARRTTHVSRGQRWLLQALVAQVRQAGAEPIFIVPPTLEPQYELHRAHQLGDVPTLLSYNDPARYADFYTLDNRHDTEHLNEAGSQRFTQQIAQDVFGR
ncbi:MAG: hypothetical protein AAFZ80_08975 [Cyanobacteria bacterium P01_A01_bin.105]